MLHAVVCLIGMGVAGQPGGTSFRPVEPAPWVKDVTRMAFVTEGQIPAAADAGVQVVHTNVVWPYFPLRRDGGGLSETDAAALRRVVEACHARKIRLVLGLPPFPPVNLVKAHPDWRVRPTADASPPEPRESDLGTRIGCNNGPWGNYLLDLLVELLVDFKLDGYSFDGNYQPALCHCRACVEGYRRDTGRTLPPRVDLDDVAYRRYLVWRGERLEDHYRAMQARIKAASPDAVVITWSVNAGRYGHLLTSPRAMPARMNLLFDMPMQEWWLDETNQGASVAPAFGAAYLRGLVGGSRPVASEPYLMSRGNPYGTDSFPAHERLVRTLLATSQGNIAPQSFGWPGHQKSTADVLKAATDRAPWTVGATPHRWGALVVSESTRQFVAYKDIAARYLPHVFGAFRAVSEEHLPFEPVNDWDLTREGLAPYRVVMLPGTAALSDAQAEALRGFVREGGGLVASCDTGLYDELGRPRDGFALGDLFGVAFRGRPGPNATRPTLDENFARAVGEAYWRDRDGVARLTWPEDAHPLLRDDRLASLVPGRSVTFKGPTVLVSEPTEAGEVVARMAPEGAGNATFPAVIARGFGKGRVVYLAAGLDAALWSYAYPYQRRVLGDAVRWAAAGPPRVEVAAPLGVQATYFEQGEAGRRRWVVHLFNGIDTAAHHGRPGSEVPLREESVAVHGIRVRFAAPAPSRFRVEPGGQVPESKRQPDGAAEVVLPPLDVHAMLVADEPGPAPQR